MSENASLEIEAWLNSVMLTWGQCGYSLRRLTDDRPVATVLFAPPRFCPMTFDMPSGPIAPDAVALTSLHFDPIETDAESLKTLLGVVFQHLAGRGVPAVEAFGCSGGGDSAGTISADSIVLNDATAYASDFTVELEDLAALDSEKATCHSDTVSRITHRTGDVIKTKTLLAAGMKVVVPHPVHPKLRIELNAELDWNEAVGRALDRHAAAAFYDSRKLCHTAGEETQSSFSAAKSWTKL